MTVEPLELSFELDCPPEHAFTVWTTRLSMWWPRGHSVSGDPDTVVTLEPGVGGRIFERTPDGTEIEFGEITTWEPPHLLEYLWHIKRERSQATDVSLRFLALPGDRTRLEILHTGWERLGAEGLAWRASNTAGWSALIPSFATAVREGRKV